MYAYRNFYTPSSFKALELGFNPIGLWAGLFTCVCCWKTCKYFLRREHLDSSNPKTKLNKSAYRKFRANLGFWTGFFLSALGSYVIVVLIKDRPDIDEIRNFKTLKQEIAAKRFRPIFEAYSAKNKYYMRNSNMSLIDTEAYNPPLVLPFKGILELIRSDRQNTKTRHVVISTWHPNTLHSRFCDMTIITENQMDAEISTMYFRRELNLEPVEGKASFIWTEYENKARKYRPRKFCNPNEAQFVKPGYTLGLSRITGVFVLFFTIISVALIVLFLENAYQQLGTFI